MKCGWESMQPECNSAATMVCYSVSIPEMIRPQGRTTWVWKHASSMLEAFDWLPSLQIPALRFQFKPIEVSNFQFKTLKPI